MLDSSLREFVDIPLRFAVERLDSVREFHRNITPNQVTIIGFVVGMLGVIFTGLEFYWLGLVLVLINRVADGFDGVLARHRGRVSEFGGYLDIVLDFIFYSSVPLAFGFANVEQNGQTALLLMLSFMCTGASFLTHAIFAAKRGESTEVNGKKSFYHSLGLMEGSETIISFVIFYLFVDDFWWTGIIVAMLCFITAISRILVVREILSVRAG